VAETDGQQDLFIRAQAEYLRGHWVEAQALLEQQIRHNPQDVESHLLLSSVYRRSDRCALSRRELDGIWGYQGAEKWRFEIRRELTLLARDASAGN
jgi:cytochrome c-type biogenesis protein CcmH/NrfG